MKNLFTLIVVALGLSVNAQDTTSWRYLTISSSSDLDYYFEDMSNMYMISGAGSSGHALFVNPQDSLLYAVIDMPGDGSRHLYRIHPFTGTTTLVHAFGASYVASACADADGNVYGITGNAATTPGEIYKVAYGSLTESLFAASSLTDGEPRSIDYNWDDTSFHIYSGFEELNYKMDIGTMTETISAISMGADEIHGAFYDTTNGEWYVANYGGDVYLTESTGTTGTLAFSSDNTTMDITEIITLRTPTYDLKFCPESPDSIMISLIYDVAEADFDWYRDGVLLPESNDTIWTSAPGSYRALYSIDGGSAYMWSEEVMVSYYTVPNVNITQADNDSLICPGETITLTGATGGTLQWYMDGSPIAGATSSTYDATATGSYNQMKTNMSGCSDTAAVAYVIYDDICDAGIEDENADISIYPNPVNDNLNIQSSNAINSVIIVDVSGKEVFRKENIASVTLSIDFSDQRQGTYIITVNSDEGVYSRKILK